MANNKRVLIVDNDRDFLNELEETLAMSGYEMIAVSDSRQTMDIVNDLDIDVILLDLKMPGKNGFELAYELSHSPKLQHVPIIAMTGYYKDDLDTLLKSCGITKCLKKPFHPLDVISGIEAVLV